MRTIQARRLAWVMVLAGFGGPLQRATAHSPKTNLQFTVHVRNYSEIDSSTLAAAERMAAEIFRRAGVESRWVAEQDPTQEQIDNSADDHSTSLLDIRLHILSPAMASRLTLPNNVMGVAPGTGPDRQLVYIFYNSVKDLAQRQLEAQTRGAISQRASAKQILGTMMAHEMGHLLLNMPLHSKTGIMRGDWDLKDLNDIAYGELLFTAPQAEVIQSELIRRANSRARSVLMPGE